MDAKELYSYTNWVGKSAQTIYVDCLRAGGWQVVFPTKVPRWASRVRNYFNLTPSTLERITGETAERALRQTQRFKLMLETHEIRTFNKYHRNYRPNPSGHLDPPPFREPKGAPAVIPREVIHAGPLETTAVKNALAGIVYKDQTGRLWYQMSAGSTIYHWESEVSNFVEGVVDAVYVEARGQDFAPVFKLISPDNTGGSVECIIENPNGRHAIVDAGKRVDVTRLINTDPVHQGSYNFSETAHMGLAAHELRDVKTHVAQVGFYVNPSDRYLPLSSRLFPSHAPDGGRLADQV